MACLALGLLVLTRLETALIWGVVLLYLIVHRDRGFLLCFAAGSAIAFGVLVLYNLTQFGSLIHLGILRGDINRLGWDWRYVLANLVHPQSGILIWSPLIVLGLAGLFFGRQRHLQALGLASLVLIALILVRAPAMFQCVGQGSIRIGGLAVFCPQTMTDARMLVRSDANRCVTVLAPMAVLGPGNLVRVAHVRWSARQT